MAAVINVNETIDRAPITAYQIGVLVMCMLVALLDGYDTQAIGYTAPAIAQALHLQPNVFGPVFSAGLFGATIGALAFGPLADRFGRKRFMVAATVIFAVFSLLIVQVSSLPELLTYRFFAGLGLGGATPAFLALGGEFAPSSKRGVFVSVAFAAFPFGGLIGALTSSYVIPNFGWQFVFYAGGIVPLIMAVVLGIWLPELLRFLIARNIRLDEVRRTLMRIAPGKIAPDAELVALPEREREGVPVKHLFTEGRAPKTIPLWAAFFMCFMVHGRLFAVGRRADHRPQQRRQRVRQRTVRLSRRPLRAIQDAAARLHPRWAVPRRLRAGDVLGGDAGGGLDARRLFRRRHRHRAHRPCGRDRSDHGALHRHRLGHGHGPPRPSLRPARDRPVGRLGSKRRRHLLRCRHPVLRWRFVYPDLALWARHGAGKTARMSARTGSRVPVGRSRYA